MNPLQVLFRALFSFWLWRSRRAQTIAEMTLFVLMTPFIYAALPTFVWLISLADLTDATLSTGGCPQEDRSWTTRLFTHSCSG